MQVAGADTLDDVPSLACLGRTSNAGGASGDADCIGPSEAKRPRTQRSSSSDGLGAGLSKDSNKRRSDGQLSSKQAACGPTLDATSPACSDRTAKRQCTHGSSNSQGPGVAVSNTSSDASADDEYSSVLSDPSEMGDLLPDVPYLEEMQE